MTTYDKRKLNPKLEKKINSLTDNILHVFEGAIRIYQPHQRFWIQDTLKRLVAFTLDIKEECQAPEGQEGQARTKMVEIQQVSKPESPLDMTIRYPSDHLPEWFKSLKPILEDDDVTHVVIAMGRDVKYLIRTEEIKYDPGTE